MTISIDIPAGVATQVVDGICTATNYDAASGKTKAAWAKEQIIKNIKAMASQGVSRAAMTTSKTALDAAAIV